MTSLALTFSGRFGQHLVDGDVLVGVDLKMLLASWLIQPT